MTENSCKLCRELDNWGLEQYDEQMLRDWQGDSGRRKGYRTLAQEFNTMLLRRQMDRAGVSTLANEAASKYERLAGDDEAIARETREVLRREGLPVDELEQSFVSYATVRTHLKDCLNAEYTPTASDGTWTTRSIEIATNQAQKKAETALKSLIADEEVAIGGDPEVDVSVMVTCTECQSRINAERAIRRGYVCRCGETPEDATNKVSE
ncbi:rod-determining factor RdfA [Halorubrum sp. RMP-47]|uniref:rod-determining factor RdfA n=1 Tax=Halorubrum miltondacostae TaxID=3076378 RepID=UPI0035294509